jgi:hypothetical protein
MRKPKSNKQSERQRVLQGLLVASNSVVGLLTKPAMLAERATSKKQPTFLQTLETGKKADFPL